MNKPNQQYAGDRFVIQAFGMEDANLPLVIITRCVLCHAELARDTYRWEDYKGMNQEQLFQRTFDDADKALERAQRHACLGN